jgi:3-deoxy-manno-octulosonate cytidylyltransferase (CMP-KDO synthetase)
VAHVARAAAREAEADLVIATDHPEIAAHAEALGVTAVMTDPALPSGTDRALAAARLAAPAASLVVNLQGDAPFTSPAHIVAMIRAGAAGDADVVTPVVRLSWSALDALRAHKRATPFSGTTCIVAADGKALWFSKAILPAIRNEEALKAANALSPVYRHVGLYGYRMDALARFSALPLGRYEAIEGLEQLRFLENGMRIQTVECEGTRFDLGGIDTPEDAEAAEALIAAHGDPHQHIEG